jgi:hypothetical protein
MYYRHLLSALAVICFLSLSTAAVAQRAPQIEASVAFGKSFASSLSWGQTHGVGSKKKFRIGYGVRFTSIFGSNQKYITAPAKLTSGKTGPGVLFISELLEQNLDTLSVSTTQINALNAYINLQYKFSDKLAVGFNVDAVGFSFGKKQDAVFNEESPLTKKATTANPTRLNALLISDNDRGTLNSEFYLQYRVADKIALKLAMAFIFAEYTASQKLAFNNDRFRSKIPGIGIGVAYRLSE